ncbi:MAG: FAD-dependent oxidoreductase [Bacteroides cellulosilyticus]|nr:FAD-dependent oxidoreductase [Bacteroides cellulosilyticus]
MKTKLIFHTGILLAVLLGTGCRERRYDVVVAGGGTAGTAAGIQSARLGARTLLVEEFDWLGGMLTSAGVSATDGCYRLRGGLWHEFRTALESHYGGDSALMTGWVSNVMFEPSVGDSIFKRMAAREQQLDVRYRSTITDAVYRNGRWHLRIERADGSSQRVSARVLIDATELGDIARMLGVPADTGMDSSAVTGEAEAPDEANDIVQDLTYVAVLKDYGRDVTIPRPDGYDPSLYACCCANPLCIDPKEPDRVWPRDKMITYGLLPGGKYMINWPIEGNDYYVDMVDMTPDERAKAVRRAKNHTLGFVYFLQTELGFETLGLADDEFPTDDRLPFIPYHRESRRIHGAVRFTLRDIADPYERTLYRTAVAVGDYPVDQHHARYSGWSSLPNLYFHPVPSYGVPLGVLFPADQPGLIVAEKSISVTNLVNGSTRLQPVVLQLGQAAGVAAALAAARKCDPAEVSVRQVQQTLLDAGCYLLPYLDLPPSDPRFAAMQRIGATGILRGRGTNVGWENQSWFDAERTVSEAELRRGLHEVYPHVTLAENSNTVTGERLAALLDEALGEPTAEQLHRTATDVIPSYDAARPLTRLECAQLIDAVADPFHRTEVDLQGNFKTAL